MNCWSVGVAPNRFRLSLPLTTTEPASKNVPASATRLSKRKVIGSFLFALK